MMAAQSQLPEAMIQYIQSFLNAKEAARTTLLSKAWYSAWLTRPNLDFDQDDFRKGNVKDERWSAVRLWKFVNKVVKRYDKLNLKIHSLRLWVHQDAKYCSCVNELIVKAMKMGVAALDFKNHQFLDPEFALPNEVFGSENLVTLSVSGCKICIEADGDLRCSKLKSLTLHSVDSKFGDMNHMMLKIISSCPLIENLSVSRCREFEFEFEFGSLNVGLVNLKCLTLDYCYRDEVMEISSPSLECINLYDYVPRANYVPRAKFDVPNIRKFTFSGPTIPKFSFEAATNTWESHISFRLGSTPTATWFCELNKLLGTLSMSKVSLSLEFFFLWEKWREKRIDCAGEIPGLTKPEVENLSIIGSYSVDPALFYCLFQCCRPVYITQQLSPKYWFPKSQTDEFMDFVYKRTMHQISLNSCFAYQRTSALCNIEEVSVEFYNESASAWRPRLLDTSTSLGADEHKIRLHLRWGQQSTQVI